MPSRRAIDAIRLDDDDLEAFDLLTEEEQVEWIRLAEEIVGPKWELTPKQELAELMWGKVHWLLWGGAAGGGKSEGLLWHANHLSETIPGHVSLILRQSIPELRRSLILRMIARIKQFGIKARNRKTDGTNVVAYDNGSHIEYGFLSSDEDIGKYLSAEYDFIGIDESTQMTDYQIVTVASRLRTTKAKAKLGARPHLGMFTNPGDVGHAWAYEKFIVPTEYGQKIIVYNIANGFEKPLVVREYEAPIRVTGASDDEVENILIPWARDLDVQCDDTNELVVAFIPSKATDNPHIDPNYMRSLNTLTERRRRQLRDGDWDVFAGQFFHEWDRTAHVVAPFDIPESWIRARGVDFGSTNPWCCLWGAWDNDGNCYIYQEAYGEGLTPRMQATEAVERSTIVELSGKRRREIYAATLADPSVFADKRGTGKSIADLWRDAGFQVSRAKNARIAGWQNVRQYLWNPETNKPMLFVFSTCPNLIRTFPLMITDKLQPEDIDTRAEDHALDALRYLLAWRPIGVREIVRRVGQTMDDRFQSMIRKMSKKTRSVMQ